MFRFVLAGVVGLVCAVGSAKAADWPVQPYFKAPPPVFDWSGFYVGIQGGYGDADASVTVPALIVPVRADGGFAGLYAGVNWQVAPAWVIGVEADFNLAKIDGVTDVGGPNLFGVEVQSFGSVRGRAGLVFDRALLFVTAGWAFADVETSQAAGGAAFALNKWLSGYAVGAGIDYALTPTLTARIEYRYYDFGSADFFPGGAFTERNVDLEMHTVSFGVALRY